MLTQQSQEIAQSVPDPFPSLGRGVWSGHETNSIVETSQLNVSSISPKTPPQVSNLFFAPLPGQSWVLGIAHKTKGIGL